MPALRPEYLSEQTIVEAIREVAADNHVGFVDVDQSTQMAQRIIQMHPVVKQYDTRVELLRQEAHRNGVEIKETVTRCEFKFEYQTGNPIDDVNDNVYNMLLRKHEWVEIKQVMCIYASIIGYAVFVTGHLYQDYFDKDGNRLL